MQDCQGRYRGRLLEDEQNAASNCPPTVSIPLFSIPSSATNPSQRPLTIGAIDKLKGLDGVIVEDVEGDAGETK